MQELSKASASFKEKALYLFLLPFLCVAFDPRIYKSFRSLSNQLARGWDLPIVFERNIAFYPADLIILLGVLFVACVFRRELKEILFTKRLLTDLGFVEFLDYFGRFLNSNFWGNIRRLILPQKLESKIGSKEGARFFVCQMADENGNEKSTETKSVNSL